jgi:hypothetical protein
MMVSFALKEKQRQEKAIKIRADKGNCCKGRNCDEKF